MQKILVSIIIPTRNRKMFLKEAIDSVLSQTYKDVELIITDDNSTDGTENFVKDYLKNKKIKYKFVKNKKYLPGPNGNKNNGFDYSRGDLITTLDDDDKLFPDAIEQLVSAYNKTKLKHIIANSITSDNKTILGEIKTNKSIISYKDVLCERIKGEFFNIYHKSLLKNRRFDDRQWGGEGHLWLQFYKECPAYYLNKTVRWYRIHENSVCFKLEHIDRRINTYTNLLSDFGEDLLNVNPKYFFRLNYTVSLFYAIEKDNFNAWKFYKISGTQNFNFCNHLKFLICLYTPKKTFLKLFNFKEKIQFRLKKLFVAHTT